MMDRYYRDTGTCTLSNFLTACRYYKIRLFKHWSVLSQFLFLSCSRRFELVWPLLNTCIRYL